MPVSYQPGSYYVPVPPATYVSASGEFGTPGGGPPPSYQAGLNQQVAINAIAAGTYGGNEAIGTIILRNPQTGQQAQFDATAENIRFWQGKGWTVAAGGSLPGDSPVAPPLATPTAASPAAVPGALPTTGRGTSIGQIGGAPPYVTPLPQVIPDEAFEADYAAWKQRNPGKTIADFLDERKASADPYAAFKTEFQKDYGRPITQDEMNSNQALVKLGISNELFTKLPLDRQMAFPSDRIAALDNADVQRLVEHNPQVAGDFPTKFWQRFSNDWLAKVVGPFFQQNNPAEWTNIVNQNQIGGAAAGALPSPLQPVAPPTVPPGIASPAAVPSAPPLAAAPPTAAPGTVAGPPPAVAPPYAGPGQFAIPRPGQPALPPDIASRSALEQYYAMLGYGNITRPPTTATAPLSVAAPAAAFPDFATWQAQNPGKTYNDYFAARSAVVPPGGKAGRLAGGPDEEPPEGFVAEQHEDGVYWRFSATGELYNPRTDMLEQPDGSWMKAGSGRGGGGGGGGDGSIPSQPATSPGVGRQWVWDPWTQSYKSETLPSERAGAQPSTSVIIGQPLLQEKTNAQIDYYEAQIQNLTNRYQLALQQAEFAAQKQDATNQIANANLARQIQSDIEQARIARDQLVQRQAEFGAELTQRQAEFGATAAGMIGGQPTLQREVALSQAELANKSQQAGNAVNAANIALRQGDQAEARRQFDIAQGLRAEIERGQLGLGGRAQTESELQGAANRATQAGQLALAQGNAAEAKRQFDIAQGLTERIQTGQLGLAGRAQTEAERAGEFGRGLEASQFQFQVQRDPASFVQRAYAARGVAPPAVAGAPLAVQAGAPPEAARVSGTLATTQAPLTAGEIKASVGPGLARTLEGQAPGEFFSKIPRLSGQKYNLLMPSEQAEYGAAALASGTSPEDLMEEIRRRSQTGTPPPAVATRTRASPRARLY